MKISKREIIAITHVTLAGVMRRAGGGSERRLHARG
jgi:hypothetical protein